MMQRKQFNAGEFILKQGDRGNEAYRIISGNVEVYLQKNKEKIILSHLGPDEILGEMGMIEDKPRSANAIALEATEVEIVTPQDFNEMFLQHPDKLLPYLKSFFERLRRVTDSYSSVAPSHFVAAAPTSAIKVRLVAKTDKLRQKIARPELTVPKFPFRMGRWSDNFQADVFVSNDLLIRDEKPFQISRNHCALEKEGTRFYILDRGSAFGTRVNGKLIGGPETQVVCALKNGENEVQLGGKESPYIFQIFVE